MAIPRTLPITGPIAPLSSSDSYPTHISEFGKGGYQEVLTDTERLAISVDRRTHGMQVYVQQTQRIWVLVGGIDNSNWKTLESILQINTGSIIVSSTEPQVTTASTVWLDRSEGIIKYRDSANTVWLDLMAGGMDCGTF